MNRALVLTVAVAVLLAGCSQSDLGLDGGDGASMNLLVSDQPNAISSFDSLTASFSEARIFNSSDGTGYETLDLAGKQVDLTTVTGSKATLLGSLDLSPGTYEKIELHVSDAVGVVDGSETDVMVASDKLMLTKTFEVPENGTVDFVFDIEVVQQGTQAGYVLLPVAGQSGVAGEDVQVEEIPADQAQPPADAPTP